jgi:hypothetical protein
MASDGFDITNAVEAITRWPPDGRETNVAEELLRHLSENVASPVPLSAEMRFAIVVDSGLEPLLEFLPKMLPLEWQSKTTCRLCKRLSDVVKFVREMPPALLVIHSNLFIGAGPESISALAAVSPGTRYLVITGWEPFVADFKRIAEYLPSPLHIIEAPFSRDQFLATLRALISA